MQPPCGVLVPLGLSRDGNVNDFRRRRESELKYGCVSIVGMLFQDGLTRTAWGDWTNFAGLLLKALRNETDVRPPLAFSICLASAGMMMLRTSSADASQSSSMATFRQSALSHARLTLFSSMALPNAIGALRAFRKTGKGKTDLGVALNVKRGRENAAAGPHRFHGTVYRRFQSCP